METKYYKAVNRNTEGEKDFESQGHTFNVGDTISVQLDPSKYTERLKCFSFVEKLDKIFLSTKDQMYVEVTPVGDTKDGKTNRLRIDKLLTKEEIKQILDVEWKEKMDKVFLVDLLKELCQENPNIIIGGSVGLYLHGVELDRDYVDLDIILPYYSKIVSPQNSEIIKTVEEDGFKNSGNDFSDAYLIRTHLPYSYKEFRVDVVVKPQQRYQVVNYNGFDYKVADMFTILEAKLRYAMNGQDKHVKDFYYLLVGDSCKKQEVIELPF